MKIFDEILEGFVLPYHFTEDIKEEDLLFFDIETTGFTAASSTLYLIGCAYKEGEQWHIKQFFGENTSEEADIIHCFFELANNYKHLIHFNGNHFDIPYITQKCAQLALPYSFDNFSGIDIYKRISPYKFFLKLPNCKQKTIEHFLGIHREDLYTGGELIKIYKDYTENPSK
ncbi:MAG: ribonuclease H-like domain-containing protein, partial [Lachnospiraceae bacterium]|nr:ribonuclease H-like domain-containing protein [Lachnospiraceae bacterium]